MLADGGQVDEVDLARGKSSDFMSGGRGSGRARTAWQDARAEPRPPENCSSPIAPEFAATLNDREDIDLSDRPQSFEWIRAGSARMAKIHAEMLRKLDELSRREAKQAKSGRRSRPDLHERTAKPGTVPRSELNASSRERRK